MSNLVVRELKQTEWERWDQWLALQPWGSPFSSAWWLDANCRAFGGHPMLLGVVDEEQLVGGVALRIQDVGPLHAVRPSMLYNPIVIAVESAQGRQKVLGALLEDIARRRLVVRPLTCTTDMVDLREAVLHHWDLRASWTVVTALKTWELESSVSRTERAQLRKAERLETMARVEPINSDILWDLVTATMMRQGVRLHQSKSQFCALIDSVRPHGMQVVVRDVDGTPLSSLLLMFHGPRTAYGVWSGTSTIGLAKGAAVSMYILQLQELQARGFEYLDWCGANLPGVSDFKLRFGGTLTTCLAISREPPWFRAAFRAYVRLSQLKGVLRRH